MPQNIGIHQRLVMSLLAAWWDHHTKLTRALNITMLAPWEHFGAQGFLSIPTTPHDQQSVVPTVPPDVPLATIFYPLCLSMPGSR